MGMREREKKKMEEQQVKGEEERRKDCGRRQRRGVTCGMMVERSRPWRS
jgi:hypothetical protein